MSNDLGAIFMEESRDENCGVKIGFSLKKHEMNVLIDLLHEPDLRITLLFVLNEINRSKTVCRKEQIAADDICMMRLVKRSFLLPKSHKYEICSKKKKKHTKLYYFLYTPKHVL